MLADAAARVPVAAGQPTWLRPVTMVPAEAGATRAMARAAARRSAAGGEKTAARQPSISGTVRNAAGKGLAETCVSAFSATANSVLGVVTLTGRGGRYILPGLRRGTWEVSFANGCGGKYAPQWWKYAGSSSKATPLHVRRGSHITGINARLVIGGVIAGTVRAGRPSGPGLGGVCVVAIGRGRAVGIFQQAVSHKDGSYRISGLGTGRYRVQFVPQCGTKGNYVGRSHNGLVTVTNGKTTRGVNAFLLPGAEITGTVTAAQGGAPLAGICVFAFPVFTGHGLVLIGGGEIQTGKQGRYVITGLPPGRYVVSFSGGCGNQGSYAPQYYNGKSSGAAADPVVLAVGQHAAGIEITLLPEPERPRLLATARLGEPSPMTNAERRMLSALPRRHTHRGAYVSGPLPPGPSRPRCLSWTGPSTTAFWPPSSPAQPPHLTRIPGREPTSAAGSGRRVAAPTTAFRPGRSRRFLLPPVRSLGAWCSAISTTAAASVCPSPMVRLRQRLPSC